MHLLLYHKMENAHFGDFTCKTFYDLFVILDAKIFRYIRMTSQVPQCCDDTNLEDTHPYTFRIFFQMQLNLNFLSSSIYCTISKIRIA